MINCREAAFDEYPLAAQMRQEMALEMGDDLDAEYPGWRPKFCAFFGGRQGCGKAQLFLAFEDDRAVGMATVSINDDYRRFVLGVASAYVNAVYVHPEYRRRGIARRLMQLILAWARSRDCARVRLRSSEDGRPLYESLGFMPGREMEFHL